MSNFNRFLNMNQSIPTTDDVIQTDPYYYLNNSGYALMSSQTTSSLSGSLMLRGLSGNTSVIEGRTPKLLVNGESALWRRNNLSLSQVSYTYTLPSGNWAGEITLTYGNGSGRTANRKYSFFKVAGGTGFLTQVYHNTSGASTDSSITFNSSTGVFTITLVQSFSSVNSTTYINMFNAGIIA